MTAWNDQPLRTKIPATTKNARRIQLKRRMTFAPFSDPFPGVKRLVKTYRADLNAS